jgi:hypothetical protein
MQESHMRGLVFASILAACAHAHAQDPAPAIDSRVFGAWKFDSALTAQPAGEAATPSTGTPEHARHGGGHGGGMGGAGHAGGMGGMGRGGGRHGGRDGPSTPKAGVADVEAGERGLARTAATRLTISAVAQRIRFDDGAQPLELPRDGMNVSGPGIGGTVAMSAVAPDLVVDTLTDAGTALNERYHVADDGRHLELHVSLKRAGTDQPREFVRMFDRDETAAATH